MTTIINCPRCEQALGVPSDRGTVHVTCPRCKGRWDWPGASKEIPDALRLVSDRSLRDPENARESRSRQRVRLWTRSLASIGLVIVVSAWYVGYRGLGDAPLGALSMQEFVPPKPLPARDSAPPKPLPAHESGPPKPLPAREAVSPRPLSGEAGGVSDPGLASQSAPPEQPLPESGEGVFRFDRAQASGKLRVVPKAGQGPMVVKVVNADDARLVCWFLIRAGESAETAIPAGSYRLKFAGGKQWYGEKHLFGPKAYYSAIVKAISIPADTSYTLSLTPSPTGTLRENRIGPSDF
jgi:hypothetical protein